MVACRNRRWRTEMMTSFLKSLKFTIAPKAEANPIVQRRSEIVKRLEDQKKLVADPDFAKTVKVKGVAKQQKVMPMWRSEPDGTYAFVLRVGFSPVEWAPGKTAIVVPSLDKL